MTKGKRQTTEANGVTRNRKLREKYMEVERKGEKVRKKLFKVPKKKVGKENVVKKKAIGEKGNKDGMVIKKKRKIEMEEKGVSKGKAKGIAKGVAKGVAKGKAKGKAKGVAKGKAKGKAKGVAKGKAKGVAKGEDKRTDKVLTKQKTENSITTSESNFHLIDKTCLWSDLFISKPLLKSLYELKLEHPTSIQKDVIPLALEGKSILVNSETGSGKTLAFVLPILERLLQSPNIRMRIANKKGMNVTKSLILLPTRELALQCHDVVKALTKYVPITCSVFCGGIDLKQQEKEFQKKKNDIFICTPGRILDLLLNSSSNNNKNKNNSGTDQIINFLEIVVFDEADKLLELGFKQECLKILEIFRFKKQILFFSATLTKDIKSLANFSLKNPLFIQSGHVSEMANRIRSSHEGIDTTAADYRNNNNSNNNGSDKQDFNKFKIANTLKQEFVNIEDEKYRKCVLLYLCSEIFRSNTIIFFRTRREAHYMYLVFSFLKFQCAELHGGLSQTKRTENIYHFKNAKVDFLLATELASRGIDIDHVKYVINYNVPSDIIRYVHRIGRTARIGKEGTACTLHLPAEKKQVKKIVKCLGKKNSRQVFKRNIDKAQMLHWVKILKKNENEIKKLVEEEKTEREIRKSEKSIDKIKNIITYKEEIMKRPKRIWFMTPAEKMRLKRDAKMDDGIGDNGGTAVKEGVGKEERKGKTNEDQSKNVKERKKEKAVLGGKNGMKQKTWKKKRNKRDYEDSDVSESDEEIVGNKKQKEMQDLKKIIKDLKINVLHRDRRKLQNKKKRRT